MPGSTSGLVSEDETRERMAGLVWVAKAKTIVGCCTDGEQGWEIIHTRGGLETREREERRWPTRRRVWG